MNAVLVTSAGSALSAANVVAEAAVVVVDAAGAGAARTVNVESGEVVVVAAADAGDVVAGLVASKWNRASQ